MRRPLSKFQIAVKLADKLGWAHSQNPWPEFLTAKFWVELWLDQTFGAS